jgi:hypothetical protein
MRIIIAIISLFICGCSLKEQGFDMYGETSYTKQKDESLNTQLNTSYKKDLYESKNKKWKAHIEGLIVTDYDHFKSEIKNNVFTTIGIEF